MIFIPAKATYYSEIGQHKKIGMAFCNKKEDTLTQMFHWVQCRDFLSDVLLSEERKEEIYRYGFGYDPSKQQIDRDKTRLLLNFKVDSDIDNFKTNLHILHKIEKGNRLQRTTFTHVEKNIYLVEADKWWLNTTFSLNLYTFMLKAISYSYKEHWLSELKKEATNEGNYAKQFIPEFESILYSSLKKIFSSPTTVHGYTEDYSTVSYVHDNGGVCSFFNFNAHNFTAMVNNVYYKRLTKLIKELKNGTN